MSSGSEAGDEPASGSVETRGKMMQRHKKEIKELQKDIQKRLHALKKGDKKEKKKIESELDALKDRHKQELEALENAPETPTPVEKEEITDDTPDVGEKKQSRAQKRREKKAQKEIELEKEKEEIRNNMGPTPQELEAEALLAKLVSENLRIHDVPADGDCLYSAVLHQVRQAGAPATVADVGEVRRLTAEEMRKNPDDFVPFVCDDPSEFDSYCERLEHSKEWGGHTECVAMSRALGMPIHIYGASMDKQVIGDEHSSKPPIRLAFQEHAFGLGAHYTSVVPSQ
eukprot:Rmarinus@m.5221